ncbi:signal recognition particle protein [Buchnera aphidicola]|uniref:signal-recognition-particle GTPase n=1 Tax=Buchnera aphidicola subsp. Tuberolachnus salignus TaxID=98804 RepID=A0A160SX37_BUCTT|nr:signal recognition particle protein [Buchnera aphidicola]CUR53238.1 Signal recognition particle protein [Buchnera aphidicola (Tuberolachnus salignus)]
MFTTLSKKFSKIFQNISQQGRLTEKNIQKTLKKVQYTLLEADVSISVINDLTKILKKKSIGQIINKSLTPGQEFIKIVQTELVNLINSPKKKINFFEKPPVKFLMVGLQGAGKTTSLIKLAYFITKKFKKKILVVSTDTIRPAAIDQLEILSKKSNINFLKSYKSQTPQEIVKIAIKHAIKQLYDILIIDTAGRLHNNEKMMQELQNLQNYIKPTETFFVMDSMTGQDALHSIKNFNNFLKISGIILTKLDSDHRGGIILSIQHTTKIPIKLIGIGEKIQDLQIFCPDRIIKRILGMGDISSLIEDLKINLKKSTIQKIEKKIKSGKNFNLNDFLIQIKQIKKIGGIEFLKNKLPLNTQMINQNMYNFNEETLKKMEAMILSMTPIEKEFPKILNYSRKIRISSGSGITIQEMNSYLKQFKNIQRLMKTAKKKGFNTLFKNFTNMF